MEKSLNIKVGDYISNNSNFILKVVKDMGFQNDDYRRPQFEVAYVNPTLGWTRVLFLGERQHKILTFKQSLKYMSIPEVAKYRVKNAEI